MTPSPPTSAPDTSGQTTPSPSSATSPDDAVAALIAEDARRKLIHEGALFEIQKRDIRRLADALERQDDRRPVRRTLAEELALPDEEQLYSIDRLLPLGGNALFAGRYKAGKTTFNGQLLKAWADGGSFLGEFQCYPDEDSPVVTIFNYEMSEGQFRRWLRRVGIVNQDRVNVVHLRGLSLPLALPDVREEVASWLREANTGLWVVDPASRAMAGMGDGSDNKDVNLFVGYLDEIKLKAGVRDMVLNIHMGHASANDKDAERAIGAQAWSAWADALWFLNKDKDNCRWFSADGRDVGVDKMLVSYQAEDMSIALVDTDPETNARNAATTAILRVVAQNAGIVQDQIVRELRAFNIPGRRQDVINSIKDLVDEGKIIIRKGRSNSSCHYTPDQAPKLPSPPE